MRKSLTHFFNHKLTQFVLVLLVAFLVFQFGTPLLSRLLTGRSAPMPAQVLWVIYMPMVVLAMLLYVSSNEAAWEEFKAPLRAFALERRRPVMIARAAVLVALPLLTGWAAYNQVRPRVTPPAELRSVHPAPPGSITVAGQSVNLRSAANPFRSADGHADPQAVLEGRGIYGQYCVVCHGDALDGNGLFAPALRPRPADFTDPGTIGLLQESYLFWRVAKGGPGMPPEGKGWNSAMPAWEGTLTADQMWKVVLYLYEATGQRPLAVGEGEGEAPRAAAPPPAASPSQDPGQAVYETYCAVCHGADGGANTPAAALMDPRPRDLRRGWYKIRTTASGQLPLDADILHVIEKGMPGTTMPGWEGVLSDAEIRAVAGYIKTFARRFGREQPAAVQTGPKVRADEQSTARGRAIYLGAEAECVKCHGQQGRGDGPSADELTEDAFGDPIFPADLTMPWLFRGGPRADDIYLRLKTGMTGSPMPSYADVLSDEDLWHLANYVDSLAPDAPPRPAPVIVAARLQGDLPDGPNAPAWQAAQEYYYPLIGQVMVEPRNFTPAVQGVWVQALYNEREVALRLRWHDRTPSGGAPDGAAVQFPAQLPAGDARPYFVLGDSANPVNLWVWDAAGGAVEERAARGAGAVTPQETRAVQGGGAYADGEYSLVLRRALAAPAGVALQPGRFIPVAFLAWDGWTEEQIAAGAISPWYLLYLQQPVPPLTYAWVPAVMALTALLEFGGLAAARRSSANGTGPRPETIGNDG